ncbi:hypothetical protein DFP72DRAFT_921227, partial [Ephemerocybe angulata]
MQMRRVCRAGHTVNFFLSVALASSIWRWVRVLIPVKVLEVEGGSVERSKWSVASPSQASDIFLASVSSSISSSYTRRS